MKLTYREALRLGLKDALEKNPKVFLIGEDIGAYGGTYAVTKDFLHEFGEERVIDAPLSEAGFTGLSIGAALGGMRPIVEIMTVNFSLLALDQIINSAAFLRNMSGGEMRVPFVIRMTSGGGRQLAAQHSNSLEGWLAHIPGLKILTPASVQDARYVMELALKEQDPVLIFEHALLLNEMDEVDFFDKMTFSSRKIGDGSDLTIITYGGMVQKIKNLQKIFLHEAKSIEVIDLRSLRPLADELFYDSIKKTRKVLIVDEGFRSGSLSAEILSRIYEKIDFNLKIPIQRLCKKEVPVPYAKHLEEFVIPSEKEIEKKIREMLYEI